MVRLCARCVSPDTRPGIRFDEEGVCLPCRVAASNRGSIDWEARRRELRVIADWGLKNSFGDYDCIVPVSGGKDSTRQALYARDELGLHPLLVSATYPPQQQNDVGAYNIQNLIALGFDTIIVGPGPETWKALMKKGFYKYGNWCKTTELAIYAIPARVALAFKIPLMFLGENNAITYGDLGGSMDGDANRVKYNNTLSGGDPTEYLGDGIVREDLIWYTYPSDEEMAESRMRIVYMGYYIEDFTIYRNAEIAIARGLKVNEEIVPEETGSLCNFEDLDENFVHVNQLLKFFKLGFARVTDQASQAIRHGMMTREEGMELVRRYDGRCAERYIRSFSDFLGIGADEFWRVADSFRNPAIWKKGAGGAWECLHPLHSEYSWSEALPERTR